MDELLEKASTKIKEILKVDTIDLNILGIHESPDECQILSYPAGNKFVIDPNKAKILFSGSADDPQFKFLSTLIRSIWDYLNAKEKIEKAIN